MRWPITIVILFAALVYFAPMVGLPRKSWIVITALIAIAECALMGKTSPSWELKHVIASWLLFIILPWLAVGIYLWTNPYPDRHPGFTAIGVLIVFVISTTIGFVVGDMGLVPQ